MAEWIDTMLEGLLGERAGLNPLHSSQRRRFYEEHVLDVDAEHAQQPA